MNLAPGLSEHYHAQHALQAVERKIAGYTRQRVWSALSSAASPAGLTRRQIEAATGYSRESVCSALNALLAREAIEVIEGRYRVRG